MLQESYQLLFVMCLAPVLVFFIGAGLLSMFQNNYGIEE
jgi:hypothetical protein